MSEGMSEKSNAVIFIGIVACSLFFGIMLGAWNGQLGHRDFSYDAGVMAYHQTASSLLHTGSFHGPDSLFFETHRRPPGYPLLLALVYAIGGEHVVSVWTFHLLLWVGILFFLWRISTRFFAGAYALIPVLFFGAWWGALAQLFVFSVEVPALFFMLVFAWSFLRYQETPLLRFAIAQGIGLAILVLIKPIFFYALPFLAFFFLLQNGVHRRALAHGLIGTTIIGFALGAWSLYSYRTVGTFQLSSNGVTLLRRADDVRLSFARIKAFTLASLAGDYTADRIYPGYAANPEPINQETVAREKAFFARRLPDKSNDAVLQREAYKEATSLIKSNPLKFILTGFPYMIHLHMPLTLQGAEPMRIFVDTHASLSPSKKLFILLAIFVSWYLFVIAAWISAWYYLRAWRTWGLFLFVIGYVNIMYALFTHAEPRYLMPVMPFYFLFFAGGLNLVMRKYFTLNHEILFHLRAPKS